MTVKDRATLNKSMMAVKNLPQPIAKASDGSNWLRVLAAELALRLKDARQESPSLWPKTIVLHIRRGMQQRYVRHSNILNNQYLQDMITLVLNRSDFHLLKF